MFPIIQEKVKNVNVMCKPKLGLNWVNKEEWVHANEHIQHFKKQYCKPGVVNLISHECLSQDMILQNYEERFKFTSENFPEAEIMIFLRYQTDWLLSFYKELVALGKVHKPIQQFVSFERPETMQASDSSNRLFLDKVDYIKILENYINFYGREKVHVFFYEDFKRDHDRTIKRILDILEVKEQFRVRQVTSENRSMSALSVLLTNYLSKIIPLQNEGNTISECFSIPWNATKDYPWYRRAAILIHKIAKAIIFWKNWTTFTKGFLDRIAYINWDLLKKDGLRNRLDQEFQSQNFKLCNLLDGQNIPLCYLPTAKKQSG